MASFPPGMFQQAMQNGGQTAGFQPRGFEGMFPQQQPQSYAPQQLPQQSYEQPQSAGGYPVQRPPTMAPQQPQSAGGYPVQRPQQQPPPPGTQVPQEHPAWGNASTTMKQPPPPGTAMAQDHSAWGAFPPGMALASAQRKPTPPGGMPPQRQPPPPGTVVPQEHHAWGNATMKQPPPPGTQVTQAHSAWGSAGGYPMQRPPQMAPIHSGANAPMGVLGGKPLPPGTMASSAQGAPRTKGIAAMLPGKRF